MSAVWFDFSQVARGLFRAPGFTITASLTLALGIGAATAIFALVDGVILRPLPFPDAERLVLVTQQNPGGRWATSVVDFQAMQAVQRSFEGIAAVQTTDMAMTGGREPQWVRAGRATSDVFRVMGLSPGRGRTFQPGEDAPGATPVVVLGHAFAQREFGAGTDPLGRSLTLDGRAYNVIGVMPPGVEHLPGMRADVWPVLQMQTPERRGPFTLRTVARLRAGVSLDQAVEELASISRNIFPLWREGFQDETARLSPLPLREAVVGSSANALWVAFGAVLIVLLIALVNVVNLLLIRVTERNPNLTIRAALGASRARLMRLLMIESLFLAVLGGAAGVGFAALLLELYRALGPSLPRLAQVAIDFRVLAFGGGLVLLSGLFFGVAPLLFGGAGTPLSSRRQARFATAGRGENRFRNALVTLEFAMALPLLVAAGLLVNSLMQLQRVDPGFDADHLLTLRASLLESSYPDAEDRRVFWKRALAELRSVPGVTGAALATGVPPDNPWAFNNFDLVGSSVGSADQPVSPWTPIGPKLLGVLGAPLLEGRMFDERDTTDATSPPVVMVSRTWAKRYFSGQSAVGKQLHEGGGTDNPVTIIGVVGDVKWNGLEEPAEAVYAALGQGWPNNPVYIYLRTGPDPVALIEPVRAALRRLEPSLVPADVKTMEERLRESLGTQTHWAAVITAFALSAVLLSAIGVFGVLAFYVSRQQREIGIRLALGANGGRIMLMVLRRGFACALAGTLIGIVLAVIVARGIEPLLYDVGRTDPLTLGGACALLLLVAFAASWLSARRAARVQATEALRHE